MSVVLSGQSFCDIAFTYSPLIISSMKADHLFGCGSRWALALALSFGSAVAAESNKKRADRQLEKKLEVIPLDYPQGGLEVGTMTFGSEPEKPIMILASTNMFSSAFIGKVSNR